MSGLTIAVIPARGGSKGIPLKNLREIGSKPLVAHTIEAALKSDAIDRVVVSTDSERIAEVAKELGAEVPFLRPSHLADDKTTLAEVMKHFIDWCSETGWNLATLVILEPTSPLRTTEDIDESIRIFKSKNADTVISVEKDTKIGWMQGAGDSPTPLHPDRLNRQFLKPQYKENGAIFVTKPSIVTNETTIGKKVVLYEMDAEKSIDVNTFWDLQLANIRLRSLKILFHFRATSELGFGHFYRVLALANRLYCNEIVLLCSEYDEGLERRISSIGWKYHLSDRPLEIIEQENPAFVVNDILDTDEDYMQKLNATLKILAQGVLRLI
jgi:CMP-N-acetylneuraminic acid synthetase